jgi:hypothetical protein
VIVGDPRERAEAAVAFADGLELGGGELVEYARRLRVVAGDVLELADLYAAEISARVALQRANERLEGLLRARGLVDELELEDPAP